MQATVNVIFNFFDYLQVQTIHIHLKMDLYILHVQLRSFNQSNNNNNNNNQ